MTEPTLEDKVRRLVQAIIDGHFRHIDDLGPSWSDALAFAIESGEVVNSNGALSVKRDG